MASSRAPIYKSFLADADLSSYQYCFVKIGTDEQHVALGTANSKVIGILMNKPTSGQAAEVAMPGGGGKLKISETVTAGQYLTSTSVGQGEVADTSGEHVGAYAQDDGVVSDVIAVDVVVFEAASSDA